MSTSIHPFALPMLFAGAALAAIGAPQPEVERFIPDALDALQGRETVEAITSAMVPMIGMFALMGLIACSPTTLR